MAEKSAFHDPAFYSGRLIVHSGDHKTGTTSIQERLARGEVRLAEGQLAYPLGKGQFNHNHLLRPKRANRLALPRSVPLDDAFARFAARTLRQGATVTVLSAERLESTRPEDLAAALRRHLPTGPGQLTVVSYIRPHIPRLISNLGEHIKIGWSSDTPWRGVMVRAWQRHRYARRIAAWGKVFGPSYVVRPAIRAELAGGDSLEDLMTTVLGPGRFTAARGRPSNESLGVEDLMRLHVIHRALAGLDRWQHHDLGWMLSEQIDTLRPAGGPSTPLRPHKRLAERMRRGFRADARAVDAARFGGRPLLADALDQAVDTAQPERVPLDPTAWLDAGEIATLRERAREFGEAVSQPDWKRNWKEERRRHILGRAPSV
ncbi:MAG: hypothetical protein AUK37_03795 [Rhodobacterales bacterium CG2_30_65_12]|nr:MAG: hypothetical protein AUK37_03795 [Rhodobacterales bacterium CG2_30_65_12]